MEGVWEEGIRFLLALYEFTTLTCIPDVIMYRGAKIQLLYLPGIIEGAKDGKGRGGRLSADSALPDKLNKEPPNMTFRKKDKGGINFTSTVTNILLDQETVKAIC
ncbi:hypothetical protein EZV62_015135 [Acer yangbiense]|uniref:Uncharacterized protein n=1 Tax=Acer yangbiense TaxID=1000413 RepID=A0A5C7HWN5_9ROSI|nr:hypothetical protein EZV62_015135 [Acer yangbiense]